MIDDYSEVTAHRRQKLLDLDDALARKDWKEAEKLIANLRIDFRILANFVQMKIEGIKKC